ncbi:hypothetical protein KAJ83_13055 [Marivibrio halodurans]|uniref:Uncharacterized protein n=1 Tax=Marivibrio halodurans TaxID=2039722 RepID=A0A8J7V1M4_9PROT|nr:hypothetical protein [Marivibrio halodurans]MBP5857941.1 hypothetical protein [Marivibrio halodurans]
MSEKIESILLNNIPPILRLVAGKIDASGELMVRNALFAMAGELSSEQTIAISEEDGPARIEGLVRAQKAVTDKLGALPNDKQETPAAQQLALCGEALGEIKESFLLAIEEGLTAKVNVRRLADALREDDGEEEDAEDAAG